MAQRNRVFPAGKGAIDLVGIGQGTLCLFELKAAPNIPAGILSELMFYTSIMRDVIPGPAGSVPRFQFDSRSDRGNGMNVSVADIKGCERIEAVLLAAQFHPLIGHPRIISILNEAAARSWNTSREKIPVTFRGTRLEGTEVTGYKFAEINSA